MIVSLQVIVDFIQNNFIKDDYWKYLTNGFSVTLQVTFFAFLIGFGLGVFLAIIRVACKDLNRSWKTPSGFILNFLNKLSNIYITIIRGTPTTVQLLIMFNVILVNLHNLKIVAILTFGLNSAAYMAEIFRSGIQAVSTGEKEAARSLGLSYMQTMSKIVMPQAFRNCLPSFGNEVITLFKETSISGFIGLVDLTRGAGILISKTFRAAPPYFASALIYLTIVLILEQIFHAIERRVSHD
ncbi:MAG: amino acid ABC transporter permease [Saccharofermentanales bacterium]|jgi:His/Glu/Gln/Arg/opine family amino acid ABC transporter permease subunit